ncbi:MAG: hypothetical protein LOD91_10645, partial [Limnochordales bacterium]
MSKSAMPSAVHPSVLARLAAIVGPQYVLTGASATLVYDCDGYTLERQSPAAVVLPGSGAEV